LRPTLEEYAVGLAIAASSRSEGLVTKVGAAILDCDGRILSLGYNGLPKKKVAGENWINERDEHRKFFIHAECNAFAMLSRGDLPYIVALTHSPCASCSQLITSYPIWKVIFNEEYPACSEYKEILDFAGIKYALVDTRYTQSIKRALSETI
jgi:dCMP deaminase